MSVEEKQARSVFVGNIPHGTTEEQMKDIFSTVGTVLSFRIVYDRETGNPKGYGFAEYSDLEMGQSAIRNLNGYEFSGRTLRVDKASSQADELRMIHQQTGGPPIENPYGENVSSDKAPEAISRAVASLPPEQMYELMKQMKLCIQNNMNEARTMLLNNPQLAYALLQAQVVMKIVEPQVAMALLHRKPDQIPPIMPVGGNSGSGVGINPLQQTMMRPMMGQPGQGQPQTLITTAMPTLMQPVSVQQISMSAPPPLHVNPNQIIDSRFQQNIRPPSMAVPPPQTINVSSRPGQNPSSSAPAHTPPGGQTTTPQPQSQNTQQASPGATTQHQASPGAPTSSVSSVDQEKAALIMQVLQLRDDQIAMLPPEQRQSILMLKEQITQSAGGLI